MFTALDHQYMTQALRLAEQGLYSTTPNPRVGCVIVKDGVVIGSGYHLKAGEPHAEVMALRAARQRYPDKLIGADVYVTLEPCSHFGRTPPCADALVEAGVARVIAAMQDPNPQVAGQGLARLQQQGIVVDHGLLQAQAQELNAGFVSRMTRQRPYVRSKIAASLDGRTALANGESKWITGDAARRDVHHWRARSCAILTGSGTVHADDPQMNVREVETSRQPLRVVVVSQLSIRPDAHILRGGHTLLVHALDMANAGADLLERASRLHAAGAELLHMPAQAATAGAPKVCLPSLLTALAQRGVNELMVEAGEGLNGALLDAGLIDEFLIYYAPVLMGSAANGMFAIPALVDMQQRTQLEIMDLRQIGRDIRLRARPYLSGLV